MRTIFLLKILLLISGFLFVVTFNASAQCGSPINIFPYTEGFETNNGGWTAGGTASDWTWGSPAKPVITGAATGINCWVIGGLTGSSYNNSENSWLQSPCFDFSTLVRPQISFSVFWEMERRFDGASMEYSVNSGTTWIRLGSANESNCISSNWFNHTSIVFLGNIHGWSGTIQPTAGPCLGGNGSNGWLTARHELSFLAGMSAVIFRFRFGAGNTCNSYDGFAVDDILIDEAAPNSGDFSYTCTGNRSVSFTSTASVCATTYAWDFGDPASGANNTSTLANPSHIFSAAGPYTVNLTITYETGSSPIIISKDLEILDVTISELIPVYCNGGQTAAIVAFATGGSGSYTYLWNTVPPQTTFDLMNIGAGTYTVLVSSPAACNTSATYVVTEPAAIDIATNIINATCNSNNGSITSMVTGGTLPYFYTWSTGGSGTAVSNLAPGNYFLNIIDGNGCSAVKNNLVVNNITLPVNPNLGNDIVTCPGQRVVLNPGLFNSYLWQDNSTQPVFNVTASGTYWVRVTNSLGCIGSDTVKVTVECSDLYFPGAFSPNGDGRNDLFGPIGNMVPLVRNYVLRVYDRYGQLTFYSTDPYKKWDGTLKGSKYNSGAFTWFATYNIEGKAPDMQSGTILLIR